MGSACSLGFSNTKSPVVVKRNNSENHPQNSVAQPNLQQLPLHQSHHTRFLNHHQQNHPDYTFEDFQRILRIGPFFLSKTDSIISQVVPATGTSAWNAYIKAASHSIQKQSSKLSNSNNSNQGNQNQEQLTTQQCIEANINNGREKQLIALLEKGCVPQQDRWAVWNALLKVSSIVKPNLYEYLLLQSCPCKKTIEKDIARAFPDQVYFLYDPNDYKNADYSQSQSSPQRNKRFTYGEESLLRVLHALANYFPHFGYTQGMNMVVGFLLLVNGGCEEEAFWMFIKLATSQHHLIMGLYENFFPLIDVAKFIFNTKINEMLPAVHSHICENLQIRYEEWFFQWTITLFLDKFPLEIAVRFWDFIVAQDSFFAVISLSIAILTQIENQILELQDVGQFHIMFSSFLEEASHLLNVEKIIQHASKIKVSKKFIAKQVQLYQEQHQSSSNISASQRLNRSNRYTQYFLTDDFAALSQDLSRAIFVVPANYSEELLTILAKEQRQQLNLLPSERQVIEKPRIDDENANSCASSSHPKSRRHSHSHHVGDSMPKQPVIFLQPTRQFLPPIIMSKKEPTVPAPPKEDPPKLDHIDTFHQSAKHSIHSSISNNSYVPVKGASDNLKSRHDSLSIKSHPHKSSKMHVTNLDDIDKEQVQPSGQNPQQQQNVSDSSSTQSVSRHRYYFKSSIKQQNRPNSSYNINERKQFLRSHSQIASSSNNDNSLSSGAAAWGGQAFTPKQQINSSTKDASGFSSASQSKEAQYLQPSNHLKSNNSTTSPIISKPTTSHQQNPHLHRHHHSFSISSGDNSFQTQNIITLGHLSGTKQQIKQQLQQQQQQQLPNFSPASFDSKSLINTRTNINHMMKQQQGPNKSSSFEIQSHLRPSTPISQQQQHITKSHQLPNNLPIDIQVHLDKSIPSGIVPPPLLKKVDSILDSNSPSNGISSAIGQHRQLAVILHEQLNGLELGESTIRFDSTSRSKLPPSNEQIPVQLPPIDGLVFSPASNSQTQNQHQQQNPSQLAENSFPRTNTHQPLSPQANIPSQGQVRLDLKSPFRVRSKQEHIDQLRVDSPYPDKSPSSSCLSPRVLIPAPESQESHIDESSSIPKMNLEIIKVISEIVSTQQVVPSSEVASTPPKIDIAVSTQQHNPDDVANMSSGYININELPQHNISGFSQYHQQTSNRHATRQQAGNLQNSNILAAFSSFRRDSDRQSQSQQDEDHEEQRDAISNMVQSTDRANQQEQQTFSSLSDFSYPHHNNLPRSKNPSLQPNLEEENSYPETTPFEKSKLGGHIPVVIRRTSAGTAAQKEGVQKLYGQQQQNKYLKSNSYSNKDTETDNQAFMLNSVGNIGQQNHGIPQSSYDSKFNNNYFGQSAAHLPEIQEEIHPYLPPGDTREFMEQSLSRLSSSILSGKTNQTHRSNRANVNVSASRQQGIDEDEENITTSVQSAQKQSTKAYQTRRIIGSIAQKNLVSSSTDAQSHLTQIPPRGRQSSKHQINQKNNQILTVPDSLKSNDETRQKVISLDLHNFK